MPISGTSEVVVIWKEKDKQKVKENNWCSSMEDGLNVHKTNKRQAECQDCHAMIVYAVGWRDVIKLER